MQNRRIDYLGNSNLGTECKIEGLIIRVIVILVPSAKWKDPVFLGLGTCLGDASVCKQECFLILVEHMPTVMTCNSLGNQVPAIPIRRSGAVIPMESSQSAEWVTYFS